MIGRTISHYQILAKLGEGGMGVVYKAEDTALGRPVALKFLPQHIAPTEAERARFIHEAKAASSLDHPNICTVYEIAETPEGQVFLAMAFYEGAPLSERIKRGPLTIDEAIELAIQAADGLHAAHEKGITHRDIKSGNLMLTEKGQVKIVDFGLAKTTTATILTQTGVTLGTLPYMSPEQAGAEEVDPRTDIWSLGVVLYEMTSGRLPFHGAAPAAMVYAILSEDPAPLTALRSDVPMELERIVNKAMQKERRERYQRVEEMLVDLRALKREREQRIPGTRRGRAPAPAKKFGYFAVRSVAAVVLLAALGVFLYPRAAQIQEGSSIAVLPFQNLDAGDDLDFLQLSLADEVATTLSYTLALAVRPSASSRKFAESDVDPQRAGRELGAATVVIGHFAREGEQLRVNLQAIDVESNSVLWGETVRTPARDWIEMGAQIQRRVREQLIPLLGLTATDADVRPGNAEAYELYLRSIEYPTEDNAQPITMLERAVRLSPTYASAWAALGRRHYLYATFEDGGDDSYRRAESAYQRAVGLNPNLVEATRGLISLTVEGGQLTQAYDMAHAFVQRRPDNAFAHLSLGYVLRFAGLHGEATQECEVAHALDPHNGSLRSCGFAFMMAGDYEQALTYWRMGPDTEWSNNGISFVLLRQGKHAEVLQITARLIHNPTWPARFVDAYLRSRPDSEVTRLADEYVQNTLRVRRDPDSAYLDAALLAFSEQRESALDLLRLAVAGQFCIAETLDTDPLLEQVRATSEFAAIRAAGMECQRSFLAYRARN